MDKADKTLSAIEKQFNNAIIREDLNAIYSGLEWTDDEEIIRLCDELDANCKRDGLEDNKKKMSALFNEAQMAMLENKEVYGYFCAAMMCIFKEYATDTQVKLAYLKYKNRDK